MIEKIQEGKLKLSGRVDSTNADVVEKELLALCPKGEEVTIDASDLEYISSAGLRVLLRLKKTTKAEVTLENVSNEVYDIFDVTGFVEILNVKKSLRQISIEGCELVGQGANGKVYRIDEETIIKVFAPNVSMEVVQEERDFARAAFVAGIPTAIAFDIAQVGDSYGAVYEMLNAQTLSSYIMEDPSRAAEMGQRMGTLLKELHETPANTSKLTNMLDVYKDRVTFMEPYLEKDEAEKLRAVYNALDAKTTLLHGDYHPKNVMYMDGELIFIDMGDVGYGHPLLDLGGTMMSMVDIGSRNPQTTLKYLGIDYDSSLVMFENMLQTYFEGKNIEEAKELIKIYAAAKYVMSPTLVAGYSEQMIQGVLDMKRANGFLSKDFDISAALNKTFEF